MKLFYISSRYFFIYDIPQDYTDEAIKHFENFSKEKYSKLQFVTCNSHCFFKNFDIGFFLHKKDEKDSFLNSLVVIEYDLGEEQLIDLLLGQTIDCQPIDIKYFIFNRSQQICKPFYMNIFT